MFKNYFSFLLLYMYKTKNNYEHFSKCGYSTLTNLGAKCTSHSDCTSNFCHNDVCTRFEGFSEQQNLTCGGPVTDKKSVGLCCKNNNDCFSNNCINGYCMLDNDAYNKKIESFSNCSSPQIKKSFGLSCSNNNDCFSNNCQDKKCMPKIIENFCDNKIIKKSLGLPCSTNYDCFSNNCHNGVCVHKEQFSGQWLNKEKLSLGHHNKPNCTSNSDCLNNYYCCSNEKICKKNK